MKVVLFTNSLSRDGGGIFYAVNALSHALPRDACNVEVFAPSDAHLDVDRDKWENLAIYSYHTWFPASAKQQLLRNMPAIIHQHGLWLPHSRVIHSFSKANAVRRLISPHGMLDGWALKNSRFKKRLVGLLYEYHNLCTADCLHALNESEYEAIRAFGLTQPVAIIPNGVAPSLPVNERESLPWPFPQAWRDKKILLFLGRIHPKKGIMVLVDAWKQAFRPGMPWRLAIVGPDENGHAQEVTALIKSHGLQESVAWLGPKYDVEKTACYHFADTFVLPSFSEGFPMAILEAFSYGLPAILTPECNFPVAVDAGAALISNPTHHELAHTLSNLIELSDQELASMGAKGLELVGNRFTWPSVSQRMLRVYQWLLAPDKESMPPEILIG